MFRCTRGRQERDIARRKFRAAMQEDIIPRAAGMRFALGDQDQPKPTPRVIQALGKKILKIENILCLYCSIFLELFFMTVNLDQNVQHILMPVQSVHTKSSGECLIVCRNKSINHALLLRFYTKHSKPSFFG